MFFFPTLIGLLLDLEFMHTTNLIVRDENAF